MSSETSPLPPIFDGKTAIKHLPINTASELPQLLSNLYCYNPESEEHISGILDDVRKQITPIQNDTAILPALTTLAKEVNSLFPIIWTDGSGHTQLFDQGPLHQQLVNHTYSNNQNQSIIRDCKLPTLILGRLIKEYFNPKLVSYSLVVTSRNPHHPYIVVADLTNPESKQGLLLSFENQEDTLPKQITINTWDALSELTPQTIQLANIKATIVENIHRNCWPMYDQLNSVNQLIFNHKDWVHAAAKIFMEKFRDEDYHPFYSIAFDWQKEFQQV